MRKFWPPYPDAFSISLWAATASVSVNLVIGTLVYLHSLPIYAVYLVCFPGIVGYSLVTHQDIEVANFSWAALSAALAANLVSYYFITWLLIRFFRPSQATEWWPENRS